MTDTERIIEAVARRICDGECYRPCTECSLTEALTAIVNLALSGVCPRCGFTERHIACFAPYHDHREALDALIAERG